MTKFKVLTKKEKIEHIWEYYKFHIIGGVAGVIFLTSLLVTMLSPRPPAPAANVVIAGKMSQVGEKTDYLTNEMEQIIGDGEDEKVGLTLFPVNWEEQSQLTMATEQKLMIMFQVNEIDILILEEEKFLSYVTNLEDSMFASLGHIPELSNILEENKDNLAKAEFMNQDQEEIYGIFIKDNIKLKDIGLGDDYMITIPVVSENKENAVKVIQWLYE